MLKNEWLGSSNYGKAWFILDPYDEALKITASIDHDLDPKPCCPFLIDFTA